jgi:multiple sugar transport system substrate-binding protein
LRGALRTAIGFSLQHHRANGPRLQLRNLSDKYGWILVEQECGVTQLSRRQFTGAASVGALALSMRDASAQAQETFSILSHRVHQQCATSTDRAGGDVTDAWAKRNNRKATWITMDNAAIHDRLQRELSLNQTNLDFAFVLNTAISPRLLSLLEPLDTFQASAPIEDLSDISPGMVKAVTHDGAIRAIPVRHATVGLFYNEQLFAERGVAGPPKTLEELLSTAERMTYRSDGGAQVNGFAFQANSHFAFCTLGFAFDAPLIDAGMNLLPNEAGMVRMFETLRDLFGKNVLPRNFTSLNQEDIFTMIQHGRVAMAPAIMGRITDFNDPAKSKFPGKIKLVPYPTLSTMKDRIVATSDFWSMGIPKNSKSKDVAWDLIRTLSSKDGTLRQALNGNGPVRSSVYADPRVIQGVPQAAIEASVLPHARPPLPVFGNAQRVADIMTQTSQGVAIALTTPQAAVAELKAKVAPLLAN